MNVLNIHQRELPCTKDEVLKLLSTLSKKDDKIWPSEKWPAMRLKNGLTVGSEGGHGPIRYKVIHCGPDGNVEFQFQKPIGFKGSHKFEVTNHNHDKTEVKHTIEMKTTGWATLRWIMAIRWLHDALIEDAFDKMESQYSDNIKTAKWNIWVNILRRMLS